ncbi:unnamed protein product [Peronospora belbahrii]|uniref:Kazal-like domain-containing protein n=1 Tax=Peronospora belbahrii TaxID=622444 RepID=A0ABN8D6D1_9STRA|nr:unnamed protein product [Peronospora belbahrii]
MKFPVDLVLVAIAVTTVHADYSVAPDIPCSVPAANPYSYDTLAPKVGGDRKSSCSFECCGFNHPVVYPNGTTEMTKCMKTWNACDKSGSGLVPGDPLAPNSRCYQLEANFPYDGFQEIPTEIKCPNILCTDQYDPVYDAHGKEYSNKCEMDVAQCQGPKEDVWDEYRRGYCKKYRDAMMENPAPPSEKCAMVCPDVILPVCDLNGYKFANKCELELAACLHSDMNIVEDTNGLLVPL